jgi:hypothetical protein
MSENYLVNPADKNRDVTGRRALFSGALAVGLLLNACSDGGNSRSGVSEATLQDPNSHLYDFDQKPATETDKYTPDIYVDTATLGFGDIDDDQMRALYKDYKREWTGSDRYIPLIEAQAEGETLVLDDVSPGGVDQEMADWLGERIVQNPLAEAFIDQGGKITFALDDDSYLSHDDVQAIDGVYGYYVAENKEVVFEISTQIHTLSAETIDQYLSHEATHMLFNSSDVSIFSSASKPSPDQLDAFRGACQALRAQALDGIKDKTFVIEQNLSRFAALEDDPNGAARYRNLIEYFKNGTWVDVMPTQNEPMHGDEREKVPECVVPGLGFMQRYLGETQGLAAPAPYDSSAEFDEEAARAFGDAQSEFQKMLREVSLYKVLTEGNYITEAPRMGHPHDGLDELAASTLNILVTYPEELADNLRYISETEQTVVCDMMRLVIDTVVAEHPDLSGYLSDREAVFLEELNK